MRILPRKFDNSGYLFACDNYFTSIAMVDELSKRGLNFFFFFLFCFVVFFFFFLVPRQDILSSLYS